MTDTITIAPAGRLWKVAHSGGVLGFANTREEAADVGRHLVEWIQRCGRSATLVEERGKLSSLGPGDGKAPKA